MRPPLAAVLIAAVLAGNGAGATGLAAHDPVLGNYMGSGRACYGMLTITTHRIVWATPFSRCTASAYEVRERREETEGLRVILVLARPGTGCRYPVLEVTKHPGNDPRIGWEVAGYPSLESRDRGRDQERISCYLYR